MIWSEFGNTIRKKRSSIRKISGYVIRPEMLSGKNKADNQKFPVIEINMPIGVHCKRTK